MRPDNRTWQMLESYTDLAAFLQCARQTTLKPWVLSLHATDNHHILEATLRELYSNYVDEVGNWMPPAWQAPVRWVKYLHYLPALQYLLSGNTAYGWMLEDTQLKHLTGANLETRIQAMQQSDYAPLLNAWQTGRLLLNAWIEHWRALWPTQTTTSSTKRSRPRYQE